MVSTCVEGCLMQTKQPTSGMNVILVNILLVCIAIKEATNDVAGCKLWMNTNINLTNDSMNVDTERTIIVDEERRLNKSRDKRLQEKKRTIKIKQPDYG